jgi:hypothetical protein
VALRTRVASGATLAFALLAGPSDAAVSPPQTVRSADGGLTVSVPGGALTSPVKIRVRVLAPAQYPPELKGATFRRSSKLYSLEPSGLRFSKPVTITRRLTGIDLAAGLPNIVLTSRSASGKWDVLSQLKVRVDGKAVVVSATTRHFSTIVAFDGAARLSMVPPSVSTGVGGKWTASVKADIDNRRRKDPVGIESTSWTASGVVEPELIGGVPTRTFACARAGKGTYQATVVVEEDNLAVNIGSLGRSSYTETFVVVGHATCNPAPLQLAFACVVVVHSTFGPFPSFTRWLLEFVKATLPANATAELTAGGVNNGQPVTGAVDAGTGRAELRAGIASFGTKPVQRLTINGADATQQLVAKIGAAPTVTSAQGVVAGQCPP